MTITHSSQIRRPRSLYCSHFSSLSLLLISLAFIAFGPPPEDGTRDTIFHRSDSSRKYIPENGIGRSRAKSACKTTGSCQTSYTRETVNVGKREFRRVGIYWSINPRSYIGGGWLTQFLNVINMLVERRENRLKRSYKNGWSAIHGNSNCTVLPIT